MGDMTGLITDQSLPAAAASPQSCGERHQLTQYQECPDCQAHRGVVYISGVPYRCPCVVPFGNSPNDSCGIVNNVEWGKSAARSCSNGNGG